MLQPTNNLINRANLINPLAHRSPPSGKSYDSCSRKLACFVSVSRTLSLSPSPPFALSLRPPVSHFLSFPRFTLFFAVSPTSPSFISGSFHPRLSSRAHSAVTKIDFLARTRERTGERDIEYIALSRPSFDFSISADARRSISPFYPFFPLLVLFRGRFRARAPSNFPRD